MLPSLMKESLLGKTLSQLLEITNEMGLSKFTARQISDWLYKKEVLTIDEMTNLSKVGRQMLNERFEVGRKSPVTVQSSEDGTKKYLYMVGEKGAIEAAYIPEQNRNTLCVSSQVGCKMRCLFCMTGKQGLQANLTAGEIINQVLSLPEREQLTNIVYMGMGEPMDNLEAVMASLQILTEPWGMNWAPKRITVSTIGVIPAMHHFITTSKAHLAVSLHTPFEAERKMLMPVSHKYSIADIITELKAQGFDRQRRVSFEYIVFSGLNDTPKHVKELARILNGVKCHVNLIRFHPIPNTPLQGTNEESLLAFKEALVAKGIFTTIRASRGQDIDAACGLLSTKAGKGLQSVETQKSILET